MSSKVLIHCSLNICKCCNFHLFCHKSRTHKDICDFFLKPPSQRQYATFLPFTGLSISGFQGLNAQLKNHQPRTRPPNHILRNTHCDKNIQKIVMHFQVQKMLLYLHIIGEAPGYYKKTECSTTTLTIEKDFLHNNKNIISCSYVALQPKLNNGTKLEEFTVQIKKWNASYVQNGN